MYVQSQVLISVADWVTGLEACFAAYHGSQDHDPLATSAGGGGAAAAVRAVEAVAASLREKPVDVEAACSGKVVRAQWVFACMYTAQPGNRSGIAGNEAPKVSFTTLYRPIPARNQGDRALYPHAPSCSDEVLTAYGLLRLAGNRNGASQIRLISAWCSPGGAVFDAGSNVYQARGMNGVADFLI
jgi:hypothetical protein